MAGKTLDLMKNPPTQIKSSSRIKKSRTARLSSSNSDPSRYIDPSSRHKVLHNYHDHAHVTPTDMDMDIVELEQDTTGGDGSDDGHHHHHRRGPRGGVQVPFPTKLHMMLATVSDSADLSHIVSW